MIRHVAIVVTFVFACVAPASADIKSEGLVRDFIAWVDSSPEWSASVSVVRSEGSDTLAEGIVLSRDEPQVSISVETLRLSELDERVGGGFTASEIELSGGAVILEFKNSAADIALELSMPAASIAEISMPSFAGLTLDVEHLMTSIGRFYSVAVGGEIAAYTIPEITLDQRQMVPGASEPVESRIVYSNLSLTGLADGVLDHQEMGPISVTGKTPDGEDFAIEIEKIVGERMDIGALARILDDREYRDGRGDNVWRPILARAAYSGLTGSGPDGATLQLDEVAIENLDGRQAEKPFIALWDQLVALSVPQEAKDDLALEAVSSIFSAWRVGTIRLDGMAIEVPAEDGSFALEGVTMTALSSDGVDSFILKGLRGKGPDGFVSLDALELAGFVSPDLRGMMKLGALDKDAEVAIHADTIRAIFAALPRLSHFGMHGLVAGKSETNAVTMESFTLDFADWNKIFAGATAAELVKLEVPRELLALDAKGAEIFDALGYDKLVYGMSLTDHWLPDAGTDEATWTFKLEDGGELEFSYMLTGLTIEWLVRATAVAAKSEDSDAALMAMLSDLGLAQATLKITDRSLLDRAFGAVAKQQGLTVTGPAYREQMRAALPFIISAAVPADLAKLVTKPLQNFMAGGQTLLANIMPPAPLSFVELMATVGDPLGLPARLHLSLQSEAAAQQ